MSEAGTTELEEMVRSACRKYVFKRRDSDARSDLIRVEKGARKQVDELVDGRWLTARRRHGIQASRCWEEVEPADLVVRARRFHLPNLDGEVVDLSKAAWLDRLNSKSLWRWLNPPLQSGARRHLRTGSTLTRCRSSYVEDLSTVCGDDLNEVRAQITAGYEGNLRRISRTEQRANVFLGASVLTSSLVLGNASLLLGAGKLEAPFRQIGVAVLVVASLCAIVTSLRALQAGLSTFGRANPTSARGVFDRRDLKGEELIRDYVAALFVATNRAATIADWKVARMKSARDWILATAVGIVALTIVVLIDAV